MPPIAPATRSSSRHHAVCCRCYLRDDDAESRVKKLNGLFRCSAGFRIAPRRAIALLCRPAAKGGVKEVTGGGGFGRSRYGARHIDSTDLRSAPVRPKKLPSLFMALL
jgi:hypothetical protein